MTAAGAVVDELLDRFPDAPALTLARKAVREHPELFNSIEHARTLVRRRLGQAGASSRRPQGDSSRRRPARRPGDPWQNVVPPPQSYFDSWRAVSFPGPMRALVLSDLHIPYHNETSLRLALDLAAARKVNFLLLNGDIADHYAVSHWERDPRKRDFWEELCSLQYFLSGLRRQFPRARIVYKLGNHEERYERYMRVKAPELLDVPAFSWDNVVGLKKQRIQVVADRRPIQLGKLNVIHGHEYRFRISNPVNPARGFFLRAKTHVLGGHFHHSSEHSEKDLEQRVITTFSTGCLCDMHPEYAPLNNWNHGFAYVEISRDGGFHVENLRVVDGRVW
jgi:predicted phosphodiesterase